MKDKKFLLDFINTPSPTMYEYRAQEVWLNKIKPYVDEIHEDNYGNVYGVLKAKRNITDNTHKPFKVLLDAHVDEISYIVNHISYIFYSCLVPACPDYVFSDDYL